MVSGPSNTDPFHTIPPSELGFKRVKEKYEQFGGGRCSTDDVSRLAQEILKLEFGSIEECRGARDELARVKEDWYYSGSRVQYLDYQSFRDLWSLLANIEVAFNNAIEYFSDTYYSNIAYEEFVGVEDRLREQEAKAYADLIAIGRITSIDQIPKDLPIKDILGASVGRGKLLIHALAGFRPPNGKEELLGDLLKQLSKDEADDLILREDGVGRNSIQIAFPTKGSKDIDVAFSLIQNLSDQGWKMACGKEIDSYLVDTKNKIGGRE